MANVHGMAGEWARVKGTAFGLWPIFFSVFVAGASTTLLFVSPGYGALLLALSLIATLILSIRGMKRIERYFIGARGEERVSTILKSLPESYHVFNDFLAGRLHVDHVVAGPGGVFAVETKNWRGRVTVEDGHILVDGHAPDRSPLGQVRREADAVKSALATLGWTGTVTPVVAFASDTFATGPCEIGGTVVMNARDLRQTFAASRAVLLGDELARLVALMSAT